MNGMNIVTNVQGVPYLSTTNISVGTSAVDLALGFRRISPVGYLTVRLANAIPSGTTTTLPITLTLNGVTRALTKMGGDAVTVADVSGTGILVVFNDKFNGILQVVSPLVAAAATANNSQGD